MSENATQTQDAGTKVRGQRQLKTGVVLSSAMDKTIIVAVPKTYMHPLYHRYVKRTSKFAAHDERNECNAGDTVTIVACRPLSKRKRWRLKEIVKRAD